jgi:ABC-2 type transport system ATP-binding protein
VTRPQRVAALDALALSSKRPRLARSAALRALLLELVTFLNMRQSAITAQVEAHRHEAEAAAAALEGRYAQALQRSDHLESRLHGLNAHVESLRLLVDSLREPRTHKTQAAPTPLRPPAPEAKRPVPGDQRVLLRVERLSKEIGGSDILQDINFDIHDNEILGLIGPNGAGKTTLIECLANLRPRTSGIFYEGDEAPAAWDPSHLMFYLPNGVAPYAELYTIEVLTLFGRLFEVEPRRWEQIIVEDLSLAPVLQKKVAALSKGNLQRLLIALALMSPQPLLALDEPFDGLDLHQTQAMMDILRRLRADHRTLLLCIHQLTDAERICDRLLLLSSGRLVAIGTLDELRERAGLPGASLEEVFLSLTGRK